MIRLHHNSVLLIFTQLFCTKHKISLMLSRWMQRQLTALVGNLLTSYSQSLTFENISKVDQITCMYNIGFATLCRWCRWRYDGTLSGLATSRGWTSACSATSLYRYRDVRRPLDSSMQIDAPPGPGQPNFQLGLPPNFDASGSIAFNFLTHPIAPLELNLKRFEFTYSSSFSSWIDRPVYCLRKSVKLEKFKS